MYKVLKIRIKEKLKRYEILFLFNKRFVFNLFKILKMKLGIKWLN